MADSPSWSAQEEVLPRIDQHALALFLQVIEYINTLDKTINVTAVILAPERGPQEAEIASLLKLATVQAKDKRYDEAIASLEKAYGLMRHVFIEWPIRTYFRVPRYLHLAGRYDEAISRLQELYDTVDARADAREAMYTNRGAFGKDGKPARVSKKLRNAQRRTILQEINLYRQRQSKIDQRRKPD